MESIENINVNTRVRRKEKPALSASEKEEETGPAGSVTDSGSDTSGWTTASLTRVRRGRGRPPTTGEYVGMARAREALNRAKKEELRRQAEKEVADEIQRTHNATKAFFLKMSVTPEVEIENCHGAELEQLILNSADTVVKIATKSSNLKGTYVKSLKEAARTIKTSIQMIRSRTVPEEVALLVQANRDLSEEVAKLRREKEEAELKAMRAAQARVVSLSEPNPPPSAIPTLNVEEAINKVSAMFNARFEAIEERLRPRQDVDPRQASTHSAEVHSSPRVSERRETARKSTRTAGRNNNSVTAIATLPPTSIAESHTTGQVQEGWTTVERKGKKKKDAKIAESRTRSAAPVRAKASSRPAKAASAKLRPPRTAAVVITLRPAAVECGLTYAKVLADAKEKIDLGALGVPPLKMRQAATGARILEVPGAERAQKADALADKLRQVFEEIEGVQISRPVATADLQVSGLDDSVSPTELTRVLAAAGECPEAAFRIGGISRGPTGMGTAFVRCPVTAARRIVTGRRLLVGWVSAQVHLLDARPRRCYRCLAPGHIKAQCQSEVDRSGQCYRCGQDGHKARECSATPRCSLCAAAGKAAGHLAGSKACAKYPAPPGRRRKQYGVEAKAKPQTGCPEHEAGVSLDK